MLCPECNGAHVEFLVDPFEVMNRLAEQHASDLAYEMSVEYAEMTGRDLLSEEVIEMHQRLNSSFEEAQQDLPHLILIGLHILRAVIDEGQFVMVSEEPDEESARAAVEEAALSVATCLVQLLYSKNGPKIFKAEQLKMLPYRSRTVKFILGGVVHE